MRRIRRAGTGRGFYRLRRRSPRSFGLLGLSQQKVLNLAKTCSMGLRSGEYLGRKTRRAPTARMAFRTPFPLWGAVEIVEDHSVARLEGRDEELLDIGAEAFAVDRAVEQAGRIDAAIAESGKERRGLPLALQGPCRRGALPSAPSRRSRVMLVLVHVSSMEDQTPGIDAALIGSPARAMPAYVGTILLARDEGLFLNVTPILRKKRLIIEVSALTPRSAERRSQRA